MNMKKMKKFFTLSRRAEGFTLVELIVVIAILAILGGVAVPAYSGYVKKANMQADMSLISEIEHALELAGYSGTFNDENAGSLILSATQGVKNVEEGSALEKALVATFGTNYADTLKLKYAEWGNNGVLCNLSQSDVEAVLLSSYKGGLRNDMLLSDVEKMTSMACDLVVAITGDQGNANKTLSGLFGADLLNNTAMKYGIGDESWTEEDWEKWGADPKNEGSYGNLLVLAAAEEAEMKKNDPAYEMSSAGDMISKFSSYYGFAASDPDFSKVLTGYMNSLSDVDSAAEGAQWYRDLEKAAKDAGYETYKSGEQSSIDQAAFSSIMSALGTATDEQKANIAADISNENLFTNGVVNNMYNDYMNAVDAMYAYYEQTGELMDFSTLGEGEIMVYFVLTNGVLRISNTLPSA